MKFKIQTLSTVLLLIFLLVGCAKANDPVKISTDHVLKISAQLPLQGDPLELEVTDKYLFVPQNHLGYAIIDRSDMSLVKQTLNVGIKKVRPSKIRALESKKMLLMYDLNNSNNIVIASYANVDTLKELGNITGNTSEVKSMAIMEKPDNIPAVSVAPDTFKYKEVLIMKLTPDKIGYVFYDSKAKDDDPDRPYQTEEILTNLPYATAKGLAIDNQNIYISSGQAGLTIINKVTKSIIDPIDTPGSAQDVAIVDNYAYIADRHAGIQLVNTNNNDSSKTVFNSSQYLYKIDIEDNYMTVSSRVGGVYYFDISDKENPKLLDRFTKSEIGYIYDVKLYKGDIYIASREKGIVKLSKK